MTTLRFYTRQGCPLCDEALEQVRPIAAKVKAEVEIIDVDLDLALLEIYDHRVPVLESVTGEVIDEGAFDPKIIARYLRNHG